MKKQVKTIIDCRPKWISLVPLFVEWLEQGTLKQKATAIKEISRMAMVCDEVRKEQKKKRLRKC